MVQKKVFLGLRIRQDENRRLEEMQATFGYPDKNTTARFAMDAGLNLFKTNGVKRKNKIF